MKIFVLSLFALVASTLSGHAMPRGRQFLLCESYNYQFTQCPVYGYIQSANIVAQRSAAACIFGRTWGINRNVLWVSDGCRGEFVVYTGY